MQPVDSAVLSRAALLRLRGGGQAVFVAEAIENLGYAGGINAWLRILANIRSCNVIWILNPDTEPGQSALAELVDCATERGKGLVGSRIVSSANPDVVSSRGLRWRRWLASTEAVGIGAPASDVPDIDEVEARILSPSGASLYMTRACFEAVGLWDERFFLYYEEMDLGMRAKAVCGVSYAFRSLVFHIGGTTLGSARKRADRSQLSVYLAFRNRLLFVRKHSPRWLAWTAMVTTIRAGEFLAVGTPCNFRAAIQGIWAGIRNETGRPDQFFRH